MTCLETGRNCCFKKSRQIQRKGELILKSYECLQTLGK